MILCDARLLQLDGVHCPALPMSPLLVYGGLKYGKLLKQQWVGVHSGILVLGAKGGGGGCGGSSRNGRPQTQSNQRTTTPIGMGVTNEHPFNHMQPHGPCHYLCANIPIWDHLRPVSFCFLLGTIFPIP